jgi:hypothetical protein
MHRVLALSIAGWMSYGTVMIQGAQAAAAPRGGRISACSLLPRALMEKVTPGPVNKIVFEIKATEDPVGANGSACGYAGTELQIDPFARADEMRRNSPGKDWQRLTGVGDAAYFHNNSDRYAELMVWTGAHHFTIQMSVPNGSTAEAVKPNTIMLANAIIPKLP